MDRSETGNRVEKCHRCLEPVPAKVARCPRCGEPIHRAASIRKFLAALGIVMFLAVAALAFRLMQTSGTPSASASDDVQRPGAPDTPPPPEKQPVLGQ